MKTNLLICALLVLGGMGLHFLVRMANLEAAGTILSPWQFVRKNPYKTAVAVVGGYMLMLALFFLDQLNEAVAIGIGVACNEAVDALRARAVGTMRTQQDGQESGT